MGNTLVHDQAPETPRRESKVSLEPIQRTANSKVITVIVDDQIQFEVDITDPQGDLTCGWLLSEVTRKYSIMLEAIQKDQQKSHTVDKNSKKQDVRPPRQKRRYIVALKTKENREGIDSWLNQYERDLSALRDGTVLLAHFAKLSGQPGQSLLQKKDISIDDFEQMRVVGRGGFSKVILARKKDTGRLYAIKILRKDQLVNENQIKPILSERKVLEQLDHPFLIKLHWAFQSHNELFFVMDICTGGELFCHLLLQRRFSERLAKFYMCEILLGFHYMHERDIVYRDIKPENILVDMDGHIRIADFGLSKVIAKDERSYSFCGSPEYLSPEMLQNTDGHDRRLDIYCLGVLLYEMLTGLPPFYDENHQTMFEKIMYSDLQLDQSFLSREVKHLLTGMLEKEPSMRYQSITDVMNHSWFSDVDWKAVLNKTLKPPLQPDINTCYFENDNGDEDDEDFVPYTRVTMHGNQAKGNLRRHSYYIHSTVQLQSCIDDRTSFMRSPSQLRQFFDSSTLLTKLDESMMLQNLQTSVIEKSCFMQKQNSLKGEENFFTGSQNEMPKIEGPFSVAASESFMDFDYAQPPLAEIQILRVLENHINRKKKDQLDKARKFREQLLMRRQSQNAKVEEEKSSAAEDSFRGRKSIEEALNLIPNQSHASMRLSHGRDGQQRHSQGKQLLRSTPGEENKNFSQTPKHQNNNQELGFTKEFSESPFQDVFSDSEIYDGKSKVNHDREQIKKKSSMNMIIAEEYHLQEGGIGSRVDHYIPVEPQEELRVLETPLEQSNNRARSKPHSVSSFHTEPEYLASPQSPKKGTVSKTEQTPFFIDERKKPSESSCPSVSRPSDDDDDEDNYDLDSIGNESRQFIETQGGSSDVMSVTQKPLMSQNTISIKKLGTNIPNSTKTISTAEYGCQQINQFDTMHPKSKGMRNFRTGLSKQNHQSLKSPQNTDSMLLSVVAGKNNYNQVLQGGQQTPTNHTKVSSMVILGKQSSNETGGSSSTKFNSLLQQQEATSSYKKIGQQSPAKLYQRQIKKLNTQGHSMKIMDQQHFTQNTAITPTVMGGKKESQINFSEGYVDDSSSGFFLHDQNTEEESKSMLKIGMIMSKQATPTVFTESDTTVENFINYGSNSQETRVSHLSAARQATNTLETVKESVPKRFNQSMKEKSGQGSSAAGQSGPMTTTSKFTKNQTMAGKTSLQMVRAAGPQSTMKKTTIDLNHNKTTTTANSILDRNQSPTATSKLAKKEFLLQPKMATQGSVGTTKSSAAGIRRVEPKQLKSPSRLTASPAKLMQNRKQANQKDFSLKHLAAQQQRVTNKGLVRDRPQHSSRYAEEDSIENMMVADETEESRPSLVSVSNASLGQNVRTSDVCHASKTQKVLLEKPKFYKQMSHKNNITGLAASLGQNVRKNDVIHASETQKVLLEKPKFFKQMSHKNNVTGLAASLGQNVRKNDVFHASETQKVLFEKPKFYKQMSHNNNIAGKDRAMPLKQLLTGNVAGALKKVHSRSPDPASKRSQIDYDPVSLAAASRRQISPKNAKFVSPRGANKANFQMISAGGQSPSRLTAKRGQLDFGSEPSTAVNGNQSGPPKLNFNHHQSGTKHHSKMMSPRSYNTGSEQKTQQPMLMINTTSKLAGIGGGGVEQLSPRRSTQTKLVSASLDVDKFQIGLHSRMPGQRNNSITKISQRNNSIGKMQKILNTSNTSLRKIENQIKNQSSKTGTSDAIKGAASSFIITPSATQLSVPSTNKIVRKKSSAQMRTVYQKSQAATGSGGGLHESVTKTTSVQLILSKQKSGDMLRQSKTTSTMFKLDKTHTTPVPTSSGTTQSMSMGNTASASKRKQKGTMTPSNGAKKVLTKQESSRSLTNTSRRTKLHPHSIAVSNAELDQKQRKKSLGAKHRIDSSRNALPHGQLIHLRSMENSNSPNRLQLDSLVAPLKIQLLPTQQFQSVTKTEKDSSKQKNKKHFTVNKLSSNDSSSRFDSGQKSCNRNVMLMPGQVTESSRNMGTSSQAKLSSNLMLPSSQSSIYQDNASHRSQRLSSGILQSHGNGAPSQYTQLSPAILPEGCATGKSYNFLHPQSEDISCGRVSVSQRGDSKQLSKSKNRAVNSLGMSASQAITKLSQRKH